MLCIARLHTLRCELVEHKLLLVLLEELGGPRLVQEQRVHTLDVVHIHLRSLHNQCNVITVISFYYVGTTCFGLITMDMFMDT